MIIPDGVNFQIDGHKAMAKGPAGEVHKTISKEVKVKVDGKNVTVEGLEKSMVNTSESILSSMLQGAKSGYKKSMKLLHAHFPMSLEVKGKDILIKNFLGEKLPRKTYVSGNTKVEVKGQNVTFSSPDKEALGQTVANVRTALRIKDKDGRIFQDGLYDAEDSG